MMPHTVKMSNCSAPAASNEAITAPPMPMMKPLMVIAQFFKRKPEIASTKPTKTTRINVMFIDIHSIAMTLMQTAKIQ